MLSYEQLLKNCVWCTHGQVHLNLEFFGVVQITQCFRPHPQVIRTRPDNIYFEPFPAASIIAMHDALLTKASSLTQPPRRVAAIVFVPIGICP